ncbi:hydantoinase/oxoprolinase family protein [Dasania marina]|uniref:hydantoinase/oxoprolinase family protein n=1 Tax=Dasania marina TaxID=471499 RepID=UPI0030DB6529|tara:strand:+ start:26659 stop:28704 length:2046 start_codon:yes stop_codon:yes gene_type:complete
MTVRVATDVGGTFTDLVYVEEGTIRTIKSDTVYPNFEQGVLNAAAKAELNCETIDFFAHGTTVVINSLTERKGVKTGLITTKGFRDVLEIARGDTPDIFNNYYQKPKPFVPRYLRCEITGRLDYSGAEVEPVNLDNLADIITLYQQEGVEAIAVCFLHAYANPSHEQQVVAAIKQQWPEVAVIASHHISREWREYERSNTTVLSAYVLPPTQAYLDRLQSKLAENGLSRAPFIMQSNGGIATTAAAKANPISLIESGPVGGILGAAAYGNLIDENNVLALDIGGTTAKCSLIHQGQTAITTEYVIEKTAKSSGYPIKTPVIDIVEIGNGGGSIAWIDAAGSLHVGPQSAGSTPGPVAYGRGGSAPTTTDANLVTGRINPQSFANGDISPDMQAVREAFTGLGEHLGVDAQAVARGVLQIANANMVNALKLISINKGYDPRDFSLMAFGGGGAMHAVELAAELNIPKVIIPPHAGVFSAYGMLMLDLRRDYIQTQILPLSENAKDDLLNAFGQQERQAYEDYLADDFGAEKVRFEHYIDARYKGQEHTVKVPFNKNSQLDLNAIIQSFHQVHEKAYTYRLDVAIEVVNVHLVAYGLVEKSELQSLPQAPSEDASSAYVGEREVDYDVAGVHQAAIYHREKLLPGMLITGPAIIEESTTTTVVLPNNRVTLDKFGGLHIQVNA